MPDDRQPADIRGPLESRLIAGRYRLGTRLGRGGMGIVWRAEDELLGRPVAVKELHAANDVQDPATLREARAVARVKHPHVVVVHDVVEEDGRPYIVMELVEGDSLAERLAARGPVDTAEAARIGLALLGALRAAHGLGVLHRDLKPANVLLEEVTGRVVLTDFGIARLVGTTTITDPGSFVGSPEYTAPERMLDGNEAGPASDLWSLGALLCAMLSGESPFHRDSLPGVLHAVVEAEIVPPPAAEPLLPVVRGLLERDPARRLDAADAERLLREYVITGATPPRPVADPRATAHWYLPHTAPPRGPVAGLPGSGAPARRRTALVAGVVVAALAGAGALSTTLFRDGGGFAGDLGSGNSALTDELPGGMEPSAMPPIHTGRSSFPVGTLSPAQPAPEGYHTVHDRMGFTIAVPHGFARFHDEARIYYRSPDGAFRIGIRIQDSRPGGPAAAIRFADAIGPDTNPGYRDGRVTPTTHNGYPAALWEFTWSGFSRAEGPRHTFDLCWDQGGRMYDIWVSGPVGGLDEARELFDTALDSFVPPVRAPAHAPRAE
ncbi:serine/threonine-protein kinase [Streptomyces sp. AK02-01A]|uniref:serine/threonine-protein kinase n=1 Tax=Streptomyces sp. AK02-01A TaxID=3028648 RepID=UPI0029BBDC23|nr:serine/threonine-protein kinase [Streptomyces sp. AK02-01A]MDX3852207.1 serine/threonine-protein kinase [Streptomyces sp. AK02-01A]